MIDFEYLTVITTLVLLINITFIKKKIGRYIAV